MRVSVLAVTAGLFAATTSVLLPAPRAAEAHAPSADDAVALYDRGNYAEARQALLALDAKGALDGPLLYRLFYCARVAGDEPAAQAALDRARKTLEKANENPAALEIPFYLANTYANIGREADAHKIAASATGRVESGAWKAPTTGIGLFQLAKLYQDQGRADKAVPLYEKAIAQFDGTEGRYENNTRWALRYIGDDAASRADFAAAERAYTRLTALAGAPARTGTRSPWPERARGTGAGPRRPGRPRSSSTRRTPTTRATARASPRRPHCSPRSRKGRRKEPRSRRCPSPTWRRS